MKSTQSMVIVFLISLILTIIFLSLLSYLRPLAGVRGTQVIPVTTPGELMLDYYKK